MGLQAHQANEDRWGCSPPQSVGPVSKDWIPAFAGMTGIGVTGTGVIFENSSCPVVTVLTAHPEIPRRRSALRPNVFVYDYFNDP